MDFIKPYVSFVFGAAIFVAGAYIILSSMEPPVEYASEPEPTSSTTSGLVTETATTTTATSTVMTTPKASTTPTEPTMVKKPDVAPIPPPKKVEPDPIVSKPAATPVVPDTGIPPLSSDTINERARAALVNIYCVAEPGLGLPSIIGSGMIIDPRGIIVTNAHIAEHLLLKDYKIPNAVTCYVRNGSPARTMYKAALMYIAPGWIEKNASNIASGDRRSGYGEEDYAFLLISETATETPLPQSFPYIPIEYREAAVATGETLFSLGYPAELLPESSKVNSLYPVTAFTTVEILITFTENVLDVLYLGGNAVSQAGSSGGGVLTLSGNLVGLIATVSDGATTADRDFQAITLPYISRDLKKHAGYTLSDLLNQNPDSAVQDFNTHIAPALTAKLIAEYEKRQF